MKEFMISATPLVIIGILLALICANFHQRKNRKKETYLVEGMCFGMCFGVTLASAIKINIALGISLGMLIGETIGMSIEKKEIPK